VHGRWHYAPQRQGDILGADPTASYPGRHGVDERDEEQNRLIERLNGGEG